ncbi:hypothetical protein LTR37_000869 [Vermiconidia calcicola]|uniref:Uncharacterized protein n=1 Tax=Vermiconidia calcicola TaxID=1690605 RepID=A0ACC3NXN2_9PEZI|nr:hypothetical protein LTR37_000869 [Vermiconidia calcicola]
MSDRASTDTRSKTGASGSDSRDGRYTDSPARGAHEQPQERPSPQEEKGAIEPGGSDDEEQQQGTPAPVGFWHPSLKHVRHEAFLKWTITTALLMAFILGCLSLYWGVFTHVESNIRALHIMVADFDGQVAPYNTSGETPIVGPAIRRLAQQMADSVTPNLGYRNYDAAHFDYDPIQVRQDVYDFKAWGAIIVNANATSMLYSAIRNGNTSYDPLGACQLVFVQARDQTNWDSYIYPLISPFMTEAISMVGEQWTQAVMQNATNDASLVRNAANVPQALSPAIGFSQFNLRPFYPYTMTPAISVGLIYLIIISFFSFAFYLPIHFKYLKPEGHPPLKFYQLIIWRWCATLSAYFMLSLAYSLISLAFQINFSGGNPVTSETAVVVTTDGHKNAGAYGHGTFPVYWMLNFFGMIALGLACENVAMIVGQPWTGLWLIFWVITNVSTSFYDIEIEPGFFHWGYAWPLHWIVEGSRQILFGLHSRIGLDFGVLIAWGAVNTIVFPFACYFMRWKSKHHVHEYYK